MANSFPYVSTRLLSAQTAQSPGDRSILLIGAMVSGDANSGDLVEGLISKELFNSNFGRTSQIAKAGRAIIEQLKNSRKKPKVSAIGLVDNASGVAATATIGFVGTATATGTINVYIDSIGDKYTLSVASGDTADDIGSALATAIGNNLDSVVTASNSSGTVTLTAVNKGTQGNLIDVKYDGSAEGIKVAIDGFSGGANDPSLTSLFDPIADKRFTSIIYPAEWGISTLTDETESRFNVDNRILDGLGVVVKKDTYANLKTELDDSLNEKTLGYICNRTIDKIKESGDVPTISGITRTDSTATVTTSSPHGLPSGTVVAITGADQSEYNGSFVITNATSTTFTYQVSDEPTTPATGTIAGTYEIKNYVGKAIFESNLTIAADFAAVRELRLVVGSNTADISSAVATGGSYFAAIPYHNTPLNLPIIDSGNDFTDEEAQELENAGGILLRNNSANTALIINEAVTTYKTDASGAVDTTYKYINYFDTLTIARAYVFNNLKSDMAQKILTTGRLIDGLPQVNAKGFTATMMKYYEALSGISRNKEYGLLRASNADAKAFKKAIEDSIVINLSSGTITTESIANIVTQVRDIIVNFTPTIE